MNNEPIEMNDEARLTAYALGELGPEDAAAIEALLERDADAKQTVEAVRETAALIGASLQDESGPELSDAQRRSVIEGPTGADDSPAPLGAGIFTLRARWIGGGLAVAAAILLAIALLSSGLLRGLARSQVAIDMQESTTTEQMASAPAADNAPGPAADTGLNKLGVVAGSASRRAGEREYRVNDFAAPADQPSVGQQARVPDDFSGAPKRVAPGGAGRKSPGGATAGSAIGGAGGAMGRNRGATEAGGWTGPLPAASPAPPMHSVPKAPPRRGSRVAANAAPVGGDADSRSDSAGSAAVFEDAEPLTRERVNAMSGAEVQERLAIVGKARNSAKRAGDEVLETRLKEEWVLLLDRIKDGSDRNREAYVPIVDNPFLSAIEQPVTTFSVDVDTASYANVRRFLDRGALPPKDAVRIEEMINYFDYDYEAPNGPDPFSVQVDVATAPWRPEHRLVRIGLKGRVVDVQERPATNLVFLIDVSGSMGQDVKLPLLKRSMKMLVDRLTPDDRVAIVTYAGDAGLVLSSTYATNRSRHEIIDAIDRMNAGGSTNGGQGIELAYDQAVDHFIEGGVNRVILGTDGDFNVGISGDGELVRFIEAKRETGVTLSVLGFGTGNFQDAKMEAITNAGNGNFAYIDSLQEAEKVLVEELAGTLVTIAKDVKIQVHFNPAKVGAYRLIGYENRRLANRDFTDDRKDAGDIGAGHTVTALYEIAPPEAGDAVATTTTSRFVRPAEPNDREELMDVLLRYKQPDQAESRELVVGVEDPGAVDWTSMPADYAFAAAVASFGMILRDSPHRGEATLETTLDLAAAGLGEGGRADDDRDHDRRLEFIDLVERARAVGN